MPKITQNPEKLQRLTESLYEKRQEERTEIHVSDLTMCLRKAYYNRKQPRRESLKTMSFWLDGERRDHIIKSLFPDHPQGKQINGVWFNPDGLDEQGNPIEAKSTRSNREGHLNSHWLKQAVYYIALSNRNEGSIVVQRLGAGKNDPFEWHDVEIDEVEKVMVLAEIENLRALLQLALDTDAPWILDSVRDNDELSWLCRDCPHKDECWVLPKHPAATATRHFPEVEISK
jgi:hypothetical protein